MLIMRTICGNLAQTGFFAGMQLPNFVETPTFPLYFFREQRHSRRSAQRESNGQIFVRNPRNCTKRRGLTRRSGVRIIQRHGHIQKNDHVQGRCRTPPGVSVFEAGLTVSR